MSIIAWTVLGLAARLQGFFNLSTWLVAIAGAAVLLLAYCLISGQSSSRRTGSRIANSRQGGAPALGLPPGGVPHRDNTKTVSAAGNPAVSPQRVFTVQRSSELS